jgi:hypothetical protein
MADDDEFLAGLEPLSSGMGAAKMLDGYSRAAGAPGA